MAITITSSPAQYQAAYNPIKWEIDSNNKNLPGFRYVVQIFEVNTTNLVAEMDVAPDPTLSGRAQIDVSRIVRNRVDKYQNLSSTVVNNAVGTFFLYDIKFGESYTSDWAFDDYIFLSGATGLTTDSFYGPTFSDVTHPYVVNDQIFVQLDVVYNDCRDVINGFFTVVEVVSNKTIKINLAFPCSGTASPGKVSYADKRKVRVLNLQSEARRVVLNAAQDLIEFDSVSGSMAFYEITATSSNARLLTNVPDGFRVSPTQHLFVNQFENANGNTDNVDIRFTNSNGDVFLKSNSGNFVVKQNSVGPGNIGTLTTVSGSAPLIKPDTEWYEFHLVNDGGQKVSEIKRFYIDRRCPINDIEVVFMDRKGSFMSFYFPLKKFERIDVEKSRYNKYINSVKTFSDGVQVYNSEYKKTLTLNSNFLTDSENLYFEELLTSPYTYVRLDSLPYWLIGYTNNNYIIDIGKWFSCKIVDGNFETERTRNKRLVRRSIDIEFDINTPINI
jgi:hypothetical protein